MSRHGENERKCVNLKSRESLESRLARGCREPSPVGWLSAALAILLKGHDRIAQCSRGCAGRAGVSLDDTIEQEKIRAARSP